MRLLEHGLHAANFVVLIHLNETEEVIEITYSYWDGSGHRKTVEVSRYDDSAFETL